VGGRQKGRVYRRALAGYLPAVLDYVHFERQLESRDLVLQIGVQRETRVTEVLPRLGTLSTRLPVAHVEQQLPVVRDLHAFERVHAAAAAAVGKTTLFTDTECFLGGFRVVASTRGNGHERSAVAAGQLIVIESRGPR